LSRWVGDLGKLSGCATQLAKALREGGAVDAHAKTEAVILELKSTVRQAVALVGRLT